MDENALSNAIIGAAIEVHKQLGPGLLESAYEECLAFELSERRIPFERQKPIPMIHEADGWIADSDATCSSRTASLLK